MISIVICSINQVYLSQVKENISATIGVPYELLVWDNSQGNKGICEVYNMMAGKAQFDYICFAHEDILFQTMNWGHKVSTIFANRPDIGVFGVAGSKYKSGYFSGWYTGISGMDCANIVHRYASGDQHIYLKSPSADLLEKVVCVDGVFICCRKTTWQQIMFDHQHLTGFHFYDIDFSLRASVISTVAVTYEIDILHVTVGGDFGDRWMKVAIDYHEAIRQKLPLSAIDPVPAGTDDQIVRNWLDVLKNQKVSWVNKLKWVQKQKLLLRPSFAYSILKFFLYRPLGLKRIHKGANHK